MTAPALKSPPQHTLTLAADTPTQDIQAIAEGATRRVAPLWPIQHFVAVNPFLGMTDYYFPQAAQILALVAGARLTMPRAFYVKAMASGRISDADLDLALQRTGDKKQLPCDVAALKRALQNTPLVVKEPLPTVTDAASHATNYDWSELARERVSLWAASHFDEGQAPWSAQSQHLGPYKSWREEALVDRTPEVMGLTQFRQIIKSLPATAEAMINDGVKRLQLSGPGLSVYFHRLLMSVGGWAGYARYLLWQSELRQHSDTTLMELLAVRLAWDVAVFEVYRDNTAVITQWRLARAKFAKPLLVDAGLTLDYLLHSAYEIGWQRELFVQLHQTPVQPSTIRKAVQAAFCIDVRSEVFRRALESISPAIDTLGFAGFFGMPIEFVPLGHEHGGAQCPVLLAPTITVHEGIKAMFPNRNADIIALRELRLRFSAAWHWFKLAAVSSFSFVEVMGWTYGCKLLIDSFGLSRLVPHPATDGIDSNVEAKLAPDIEPTLVHGHATGMTLEVRVKLAEGALKAMSLRKDFARLVMLAGHGASSVNNPYASGLDCGACGGHSGEANARVAAAVLNDFQVRHELVAHGIRIPDDTWFIGALHNTTTDQVTIFDCDAIPVTHVDDLAQLQAWLTGASERARIERASALKLDNNEVLDAKILARGRDWSQVRPEWGLAGCAAYIVAPRGRTVGLDFGGRVFLNSYDWHQDEDFSVLESIMTAPMVVGAWISLQYYGSAVDNQVFGSGNKVLHNVVGKLGVLEGNGGDLRTGLPWQSVRDGERLVHEPLRMSALIAAPIGAINAVIAKHEPLRDLVDHGWVHLFAIPDAPAPLQRYCGAQKWECAE